jgi:membrane-bound lytic murein transglycosylase D
MHLALVDRIKQYYGGKNIRLRIVFGLIALIILLLLLVTPRRTFQSLYEGDAIYFALEAIPLDGVYVMNQEKFDREITLTLLNPAQIVMLHKRENQYIPFIENALRKADIPDDFKYLAIAESSLRNSAISSAGAAGIWQFMPDTARRYGLLIDEYVDERMDFEKSTAAAMEYLQDLYDLFGNWTMVAAAYNRGENGLQRDLSWQGVDQYYDAWLNSETSRYVYRILALKEVLENREKYFDSALL